MNRFVLLHKHPAACLYAVGLDDRSTGTLLLSLFTIAGTKKQQSALGQFSIGRVGQFSISADKLVAGCHGWLLHGG
ncbi:hypothetical protein [Pseudomonas frederiksbergensis]|uniref:hypothetical protein n=1 Tax=Pseudomonas frederiksbergensis TaxID=104087 RepID=UPI0011CDE062|nr:hypothetical protein [Pseudomonas frederiksbergensis]